MVNNIKKIYTSYFGWHLFLTVSEQSSESAGNFPPHLTTDFQKGKFILLKIYYVKAKRKYSCQLEGGEYYCHLFL